MLILIFLLQFLVISGFQLSIIFFHNLKTVFHVPMKAQRGTLKIPEDAA